MSRRGVPSAIFLPWSRTMSRSHRRSASSMKWVVSRIALPCCSRFCSRSHIRWRACGSSPVVGSSSSSRSGSLTSARASERRRFMPPESSPGLAAALDCSAAKSSSFGHALVDDGARQAEVGAVDAQVLGAGEVGVEAVELGDDADPLLGVEHALGQRQAEGLDRAAVGPGEAEADADRRRLAGAVRADHAEALARHDLEREVVDDGGVAELLRQVRDAKERLGHADVAPGARRQASASLASVSTGIGRSTSSTKAMGALSPTRKPIFRMRV